MANSEVCQMAVARPMGRPLGQPVETFAAVLYARLSGHSKKRALEIIHANPNAASGAVWAVAADAARSNGSAGLLAGIPLVDWIFMLPVGMAMEETRAITGGHGLIWVPPLAFLAGIALQRLAPAT